jgi:hypothetical protein
VSHSLYNRQHYPYGVPMRRRRIMPKSTAQPTAPAFDATFEKRRFRRPPKFFADTDELVRKVVLPIVNDLQRGKANNTYEVTLTASVTSTTVTTDLCTEATEVTLTPKSLSAAAAIAAGVVYTEPLQGSFIIHHDSSVATDRTFGAVLHG